MPDSDRFIEILRKHAKTPDIDENDVLFSGGLDISSLRFVEFLMELEEEYGLDIDPDALDPSIKTVGQLRKRLLETPL